MISIKIEDHTETGIELVDPSEMFGKSHGTIFRMYSRGLPCNTYFISTGTSDRPICIWWDNECGEWRLSSDSKKDLKRLLPHIMVKEYPYAKIEIQLDIE